MRFDLRSKSRREAALRSRQRTRRPETGDTLIEVLLAVMVMGISSAAILLAFGTSIFGSSEYRGLATTDTVLRTVAEEVTNDLQIQSTTMWLNCSGVFAFDTTANPTGQTVVQVPSSYKVSSITATYWSSSQGTYVAQTASELPPNTVSCPTAGQPPVLLSNPSALVTITIASGANSYSISTVVNDPAAPATPVFGTATKLVFIGQPGNGTVGNALSTPPEVAVEDVNSQIVTTDLSSVQLALTSPSDASGAALSGDCSGAEIGGVITFSNCSVNKADVSGDGGFTLTATDTGLASATSSAFYVSAGTPAQIVFSQQPGNGLGGAGLSPEPQVTVEDAYGDVVTNDASSLSLSILSGTGATGAQVTSGCSSPTESAGVFSFTNCGVNLDNPTNNPYQFVATDGTMTADSSSFTVSTGPAAGLVFTTSPGASTLGSTFSANPVVAIADAGGNPLGSAASATTINLALQSGSGTLSCTNTSVTSSGGSATFSGCKILTGGTQGTYQLKATGTYTAVTPHVVLTPGVSSQFTVAGGAFALLFTTTPGPSSTGATFAIQPVVEVVDSSGDLVTTSNASISLKNAAVAPNNAGTVGCPLSVPVPSVTAVNGIATFSNCELTVSGSSEGTYTLDAYETSTPTITGNSGPFKVAGTPTQLAFTTSPGPSTTGTTFAAQPVVAVEDTAGDLVTSSTAIVTLSVNSGSGTVGCPTSTGDTVTAVGGIASFSQCQVALSGTGGGGVFKLGAAVPLTTLTGVSSSFSVAGPATKLAFTTQPSNGTGGVNLATQPQVTVEDANGYPVTADSSTVVLSLNPPLGVSGAAMSDTCSGTETAGVVAFAGCSVNEAANGYTFGATDGSLTSTTSSPFNITVGAASQLVFTTSPQGGTAGQAFGVQPVVSITDAGGNLITTGSPRSIALTITGGAPLTCTSNTATTSGGIATFAGCSTTSAGANISLTAAATGFPAAFSQSFNVSPGAASKLLFASSPVSGAASATPTIGPIGISETDAYGNPVLAGASGQAVTLSTTSIGNPTFSYVYGGTSSSTVTIPYGLSATTFYYGDEKAASPTVTISATGFAPASQAETVVAGPASQLAFTSSPLSGAASATANIGPITVQEQDPFGNPSLAGSAGQAVSLSATGTGTFSGSAGGSGATSVTIPASSTSVPFYFGDRTLGSQTVTASAFGTQATQSETIGASIPSASLSTAVASPTTGVTANGSATSTITVTLEDAFGNPVANKAVSLTPGAGSSLVTTVSGTTDGSGVATFTVTDTVAQTVTYTAKDTTDGITLTMTPTVAFVAGPASPLVANSTVVANPTSVSANGTSYSTITVTVNDANNNPRIGDTITLSAGSGSSLITTVSGTTNSSGVATFTVADNTAQSVSYIANDVTDSVTLNETPTVTFVSDPPSAANSTAVASPATGVTANGTTSSLITVTIKDGATTPLPIANQTITLTQGTGSSVITTVSGTTNSSGVATFTVTDTHAQTVTYTATDTTAGVAVSTTPTVAFVAGPASASVSTAVASPTSLGVSNTATSTIAVTDTDAQGNPIVGDRISLTQGSGLSVITTSPATTNASGVATFTVKDTHAQTVTYTATDTTQNVALTTTPTVTFVIGAPSASVSTVLAGSSPVKANGTSNTTITVTDTDAYGNPIVGDSITLTGGSGSSVISTSPTTTNSSGVATFTVADNTAQTVTYTAKDTTAGVTFTQLPTVTFSSDAVNTTNSSAVANPPSGVTANGTTSSTITVTIKDGSSPALPIANQTVTLNQGTGSSLITTVSGTTNQSGIATFTVTDATAQTVTYTATDTTASVVVGTPTVAFVAGPASPLVANSTVVASPISQLANGTSYSTITVTSKDANNNPEIGDTVTLNQGTGSSLITTVSGTTNSSGVATFTVADNTAQAVVYTATDVTDSVTLNQTPTVTFTSDPPSAANSTAVASPTTGVTANGSTASLITVTIKDGSATPLPIANQTVTLTQGAGLSVITPTSATTNSSGVATFSVTDTHAQTVTYTATDTTAGVAVSTTPTVTFVAGLASASTSTVAVIGTNVVTDNNSATATIQVTALDANGNPETGDSISLTASPLGAGTITTSPTTAGVGGVATFLVKDNAVQNVTYTAKDVTDNVTLSPTQTIDFVQATSPSNSAVQANHATEPANGTSFSTITVTDKNSSNVALPGRTITLTQGAGSSVITTVSGTTNSSGQATFTVADNTAQAVTYSATDTTANPSVLITETAPVTFTSDTVSASNSTVGATYNSSTNYTVTVTILDTNSLPVANQSVTLTAGSGSSVIATSPTTTNSQGQATFTVTDTVPFQSVTYTATDTTPSTAVQVNQTARVTF